MAGPIDCRVSPTEVNKLATDKPIDWFERNLISTRAAALRRARCARVYPGFLQLDGVHEHEPRAPHRVVPRALPTTSSTASASKAEATRAFYEEYFAVADLPAEFYLETVRAGVPGVRAAARRAAPGAAARSIPAAIRRTALLTVEGERDDICSLGQTLAAQDLCSGLRPYLKHALRPGRRRPLRRVQRQALERAASTRSSGRSSTPASDAAHADRTTIARLPHEEERRMSSTGKIAIVTGAGSGIGKSVALTFLKDGYRSFSRDAAPMHCSRPSSRPGTQALRRSRCRPTSAGRSRSAPCSRPRSRSSAGSTCCSTTPASTRRASRSRT